MCIRDRLAGSIPASLAQTTYERLLARLEGRGIRAVVDATRDLLVNVLPYKPFLIKPNNHELSEITGVRLTNDKEIAAAAHMMQDKGARNVLVSMAGDGALLLDCLLYTSPWPRASAPRSARPHVGCWIWGSAT